MSKLITYEFTDRNGEKLKSNCPFVEEYGECTIRSDSDVSICCYQEDCKIYERLMQFIKEK
jgi:hypothetical protein